MPKSLGENRLPELICCIIKCIWQVKQYLWRGSVWYVLVVLTILVHGRLEALSQATGATLIPMGLVHRTATLEIAGGLTGVNPIAMNAPLEKTGAA